MPISITITIDGKTETRIDQLSPCDVQELADWHHDLACHANPEADRIHVAVTSWIDSDESEQETAEQGWK